MIDIREAKRQLADILTLWKDNPAAKKVVDETQDLTKKLFVRQKMTCVRVRNSAPEDPLNYPIKIGRPDRVTVERG